MTTRTHPREASAAFVYFLSGSIGATGINVITGVLTSSSRSFDSFVLIIAGIIIVFLSYLSACLAVIYDHYERLYISRAPDYLSEAERSAIWDELLEQRSEETSGFRVAFFVPMAAIALVFIVREVVLFSGRFSN